MLQTTLQSVMMGTSIPTLSRISRISASIIISAQYPSSIKICSRNLWPFAHQYCIGLVFQFAHLLLMTKDPLNLNNSYIYHV